MMIHKTLDIKMKRCPFCGGRAMVNGVDNIDYAELFCECSSCGARTKAYQTENDIYSDEIKNDHAFKSALHSWNIRYPNKAEIRETVREVLAEEQGKDKAGDQNG